MRPLSEGGLAWCRVDCSDDDDEDFERPICRAEYDWYDRWAYFVESVDVKEVETMSFFVAFLPLELP